MKMLKVGDVIRSTNYNSTGLQLGRDYKVVVVKPHERGIGNHYYVFDGGYCADQLWLEKGYINVVSRSPEFKVGDVVRIIEGLYDSINDQGKRGIIRKKHWEQDGITMFGVAVEGCEREVNWSYTNHELERA
ncbi:hypothetical protein Roomu2_00044 [Pseudomonas phage vB_PpuM-Roomu-2]|uniref:YopX protein domain-containing protein n=1 Tax=Pseudomonas phage vB_PpuM-Roomu-2 TaxID=3132621 RepID=A0AAX4MZQ6_9CAUD